MALTVELNEVVADLLKVSGEDSKLLFGIETETAVTVLACASASSVFDSDGKHHRLKCCLPGGVAVVGVCAKGTTFDYGKYATIFEVVPGHKICISVTDDGSFAAVLFGESGDVDVKIVSEDFLEHSVIARCKCNVPVSFVWEEREKWKHGLHLEIERVIELVTSENTLFHLTSSNILLRSAGQSVIPDNVSCDSLFTYINTDDDEGVSTRSRKKEKTENCLSFDVYTDLGSICQNDNFPSCSPVINYNKETVQMVQMTLDVDSVSVFPKDSLVQDMVPALKESIVRQLHAMEDCISRHSKDGNFQSPEPFHFKPLDLPVLFTVMYPKFRQDEQLEHERREVHRCLCLPVDRPMFRRANRYRFPGEETSDGYLLNVHKKCPKSKVQDGRAYTVQGSYSYHHYMQDRFDDNKWGCAYRSLQTLVSWFRLQGYTEKAIPTHKEIQQVLVDIGDKEPSFVGSRKWIGSMEVSFVLDTLLGVTSKILNVSSGAELSSKGRELAAHFTTQGTPIMIGGGVLAHTILGVDYNEITGDINFLILDPHYTGSEDIKTIIDKGWCGWKDGSFWDVNAHYNLCMPQRPKVI